MEHGNQMKAAVFTGNKELVIKSVPIPKTGDDEVRVKIKSCGVCHTDEGYIEGTPTYMKPPLILGHEAAGYIDEIGKKVSKFVKGDAVLIPPVLTCGLCKNCLQGRETLCLNQKMLGNHINGAFAEYIVLPAKDLVKIPKGLEPENLAIVADAIATPYHAVFNRAKIKPGDVVAVIGCGGVGINVIQFASMIGARVIAIDIMQSKLNLAKDFGALYTIRPPDENVKNKVKDLVGSVDIAFEVIGNPNTQQLAFDILGPGGKLIAVGYSPSKWPNFNSGKVMFRELEIIGSLGCPPKDFPRILELIKMKKIKVKPLITHRFKLEQINEAFYQLRKGDGIRIIIDMD